MDNASMAVSFHCYDCEEDECAQPEEQLPTCKNAVYCWKSTNREADGTVRNNRGCFDSYMAMRLPFPCKSRGGSKYQIECCQTDLCNGGSFPTLQPVPGQNPDPAVLIVSLVMTMIAVMLIVIATVWHYNTCMDGQAEESVANGEVSQPAGSPNAAGNDDNSWFEQLELNDNPAGDSQQRQEHNQPAAIDSEINNEESQRAGSSNVAGGISSNRALEQLQLNATPADYIHGLLARERRGSFTDITYQRDGYETHFEEF